MTPEFPFAQSLYCVSVPVYFVLVLVFRVRYQLSVISHLAFPLHPQTSPSPQPGASSPYCLLLTLSSQP